ncbi:MAG: EscU/YscU/HrcU family type III secretion system export apparatus switch protein, partial [Litoreibacter sp.]
MSEEEQGAEKSFDPTPKRLEDARKKGEIAKSTDLTTSAAYLGLILSITVAAPITLAPLIEMLSLLVVESHHISTLSLRNGGTAMFANLVPSVIEGIWPLFAIPALLVLLTLLGQRAIVFSPSKIAPKLSKISMISGAKNKFGPKGLFEFAKSAVKLGLVSALLAWFAMGKLDGVLAALLTEPMQIMERLSDTVTEFLILVFIMSLVIGGIDYLWQVHEHYKKNMMTRQEVTDEAKQSEGDPHLKQQRRQRAYDIAMQQMLQDVPTSDVVIVNPTHFAVALKWDR